MTLRPGNLGQKMAKVSGRTSWHGKPRRADRWGGLRGIEQLEDRRFLSSVLTTVVAFVGSGGTEPYGGLMADAQGNLYGTTIQGPGGSGLGTVFEVPAGGGAVITLASFNGINGESPQCGLIADADGNLYGTASFGGNTNFNPGNNDGAGDVFEVPAGSGTVKILASFNGSDGGWPQCTLIADAAGNLYGTAVDGGIGYDGNELTGDGTVFEVPASGGVLTTLVSFNGSNGSHPNGTLIADAAGNLYGTTMDGGAHGLGTVFEVPAAGGGVQTLVSFNGSDGSSPSSGLIADADGNLYGTTAAGGANGDGTVFELPAGSGTVTLLASFNGSNGSEPGGGLIADAVGNLYGTTWASNGNGTVFKVPAGGAVITTLATFSGINGSGPDGPLIADAAGNLYGTTWYGGPAYKPPYIGGNGTLFKLSGTGFVVPTHLAFAQQPGSTVAGQPISPAGAAGQALVVDVLDPHGIIVSGDRSTIILTLHSGNGTLGGTTSVQAVHGVATFSNLVLDQTGSYTLQAKDGSLTPATSKAFAITPDLSTAHLVWAQEPSVDTLVGKPLTPNLTVQAVDRYDNVVTADHSKIILSTTVGTFTGASTMTLSGGKATFSNLVFKTAGSYVLTATPATNSTLAVTTPVTFRTTIDQATTNAIPVPAIKAGGYTYDTAMPLAVKLTSNAPSSIAFAGTATLVINGTDRIPATTLTAAGAAKFTVPVLDAGSYSGQIIYAGDVNHSGATSGPFAFTVNQATTTTMLAASSASLVFGQSLTLTATVKSSQAPAITRPGSVEFLVNGTVLQTLSLNGSSSASLPLTATSTGSHNYQAIYVGSTDFKGSVSSLLKRMVGKDKTAVMLTPSVTSPINVNQTFNVDVQMSVLAPGSSVLTGDFVILQDNGKSIGTLTLDSAGKATQTGLSYTASGTHSLIAVFAGDEDVLMMKSSVLKLVVA